MSQSEPRERVEPVREIAYFKKVAPPALARRIAPALVLCAALASLTWLWWTCTRAPGTAFLPRMAGAQWIIYPTGPVGTVHPRLEMSTVFKRSFTLEQAPVHATLSVAGFRQYSALLNGKPLAAVQRQGDNWKQPDQYDVTQELHPGENELVVTVFNSNAPPTLWLSVDTGGWRMGSDESWLASYGGASWRPARLASKPKIALPGSLTYGGEEPWASLRACWATLLLFLTVAVVGWWLIGPWRSCRSDDGWLLLLFAAGWLALFLNNLGVLPNLVGFDADAHLAYIHYIQQHHALPPPNQGWETFQPPLYYTLGACLLNVLRLSVSEDGGVVALRLMGMVFGLVHLLLVWLSLKLLFPGERAKAWLGMVLAAALPPLLYLSQYPSNEGLAAVLVTACVFLTLRMLKQEPVSWKACAGLGFCLGAALLTKSTALLVVPPVLGALLLRGFVSSASEAMSLTLVPCLKSCLARLALILAVCLTACGWHYFRLWSQYGSPLIGVWDPRLGFPWWQDDGYRTGAFYFRFGAVLTHPWFSSFKGFGDGLYATLWGDGLYGGAGDALRRPPWNFELMAVGYWLALVPTVALVLGGAVTLIRFLRQPSPQVFLILGLAFLSAFALIHMSLALPYQCHVKAFYALCALVPLCAFAACGFDQLYRPSRWIRLALCLLFGVWAINSIASFWILRSTAATCFARAQSLWKEGRNEETKRVLEAGLQRHPGSGDLRTLYAGMLLEDGNVEQAGAEVEAGLRSQPDHPKAHLVLAVGLARRQQLALATEHAWEAVRLAPGAGPGYDQLADLLLRQARYAEAVQVSRDGLAVAPFSPVLRFTLGAALVSDGKAAEGIDQLQLACLIKPDWDEPWMLLGTTLAGQGDTAGAVVRLQKAVRLQPSNASARSQLAAALSAERRAAAAVAEYREALRLEPDLAEALNNLAWILAAHPEAELRNGPEAVRWAERACKVTAFKQPMVVGTLAAAYAEAGRFEEAVEMARKARELALAAGQQALAGTNEKLIELFKARQPYHEPARP